jgi:carbonic anhydrase
MIRAIMKLIAASVLIVAASFAASPQTHAPAPPAAPTADATLAALKEGNERHVLKHYVHPNQTAARQKALVAGQQPPAAILSCADSRVPPEIVFDQGLGDMFTVRVAGNVADDTETASLEYAAEHVHCPVIVVLGHQHCGALTAAVEGGEAHGHLPVLMRDLKPAVDAAAKLPGDRVENAIRLNVEQVVRQLRESRPVLGELVAAGRLKIVGGVYSLETGKVAWLQDTK